jgi:hypothetical protein
MKLFEIQNAISKGNFSLSELNDLQTFIGGVKTSAAKATLKVGDSVWVVQKTKRTPGVIESIKVKKAIVDMRGSKYNVPLSMIEAQ